MAKETISQTEGLCKEVANCIRNAYDRGYKQGYKDGNYDKEFFCNMNFKHGTNKGLDDAWECIKRIESRPVDGGFTNKQIQEIFGEYYPAHELYQRFSIAECIQKINEYEEKQKADDEIKVGDEVYIVMENYPSVVTCVFSESGLDNPKAVHITKSGKYAVTPCSQLHKTGRHFDQIAEVLEQLKGE